jgi:hypothetical protein
MKYEIPFTYTVNASVFIEASSLESAIDKATHLAEIESDGTCRLIHGFSPVVKTETDLGSIRIDKEEAEERNPKKRYTVKLVRTQTVEIEVEAHSLVEAEETALEEAENNEFDYSVDEEEIVAEEVNLAD